MANEMRLIDADALLRNSDVFTVHTKEYGSIEVIPVDAVGDAPTVDAVPVVHGRWEHLGGDEWCCTVCGEVITTEGSWVKPDKKYCYECGSQMDGGDGDG